MMIRRAFMVGAISAVALMLSADLFAQQSQTGTAREAQAMLTKTIAAMKTDKTNTIAMINKGEGGFLQGDIYPFCFQISDGKVVATAPQFQKFIGTDIRTLKDPTGKVFGPDLFAAAKEGKITEVGGYQFPKPGTDTPVPKVSFVTAVSDLGCGVGYYK
jgi:signal transduction histidine kinase